MAAYYDSIGEGYYPGWNGPGWYEVDGEGIHQVNAPPTTAEAASRPGGRLENSEGDAVTYEAFMAATPEERRQVFQYAWDAGERRRAETGTSSGAINVAAKLRNIKVAGEHSSKPLSDEQYRNLLMGSGLSQEMMQAIGGQLSGILTQQAQDDADKDWIDYSWMAPFALAAPAVLEGAFAGAGGAASGGATAAGAGEAGLGAAGLESLVGPATGTVEAAPVIGAAGAPTVSGVASGAGPFVPVVGGMTGPSSALSRFLGPSASAGGTASTGTAGTAAATGGASAAMARILRGEATLEDYLSVGGTAAPGLIGAAASNQQANSLEALNREFMAVGAPSRARFESSFAPGFSMATEPGYKNALDETTKSFLHKASISGNPAESPNAWQQALKDVNSTFAFPALQQYRNQNAAAGGLSSLTSAAPAAAVGAINADANVFNSLGGAAADVFNPPRSLSDLMRELRRAA